MIKHNVCKNGFWVISAILILAMIIINATLRSPISEFGCLVAVIVAELAVWFLDLICFGYKDSTVRLWLSGGIVSIIVGISIIALGGIFIENFDTLETSRPWMFMGCIITLIYIVSSHHILVCRNSKNK